MKKPLEIGQKIFIVDLSKLVVLSDMEIFVPDLCQFNLVHIGHLKFNSLGVLKDYNRIKTISYVDANYNYDTNGNVYLFFTTKELATSFLKNKVLPYMLKEKRKEINTARETFLKLTDEYGEYERKLKDINSAVL